MNLQSRVIPLGLVLTLVQSAPSYGEQLGVDARISPRTAIARAVNDLRREGNEIILNHPGHTVRFSGTGVEFSPRRGPRWTWSLARTNGEPPSAMSPSITGEGSVRYQRGAVAEQYLLDADHVEQQFVIERPSRTLGQDLVIEGTVRCDGVLEQHEGGWLWRDDQGVVSLGDVRVFDRSGRELPAAMAVNQDGTRIVVDGSALADALFPVTIDPEIGTNDFRLSDMGIEGDITFDGTNSCVAYNATNNQYLVVWQGDDNVGGLSDGEFEIFGQRIDAANGNPIGSNDFRISDMGTNGVLTLDAVAPSVTWNSTNNEYLVVWSGDDATVGMADGEYEIFGQRIVGATGAEVGTNDFRISDVGTDGDPLRDANDPAVVYNSTLNEYLVLWSGDEISDEEYEIYGQRLSAATGAEVGVNDFRLSDMGADGDPLYDAELPRAAYAASRGEYLVVWQGDDNTGLLANGEFEIFGQRVVAATGTEIGTNDQRLSDMGADGDIAFDAQNPAVGFAVTENRYFVVWSGDDNSGTTVEGEREIFGQFVDATTGAESGSNDLRVSEMGPDGDPIYDALSPSLAYNPTSHEFLVAWDGDDKAGGGLDAGEFEIFGQRINAATGAQVGANDFPLSEMGIPGHTNVGAVRPMVAIRTSGTAEFLVTWHADQDTLGTVDDEFEIYGQRVVGSNGNETGVNDFRISDMGVDGDIDYDARQPCVAYNPNDNEYLVVWEGDDSAAPLVDGETEIFGQRISAMTGEELGANDFRISDMGPNGDPAWDAQKPGIAYNTVDHEYLVVWSGEDDAAGTANGEFEIFAQRLSATGVELGANDFRVSDMGPDADPNYDALNPEVVYNPTSNEYFVVWEGDDLGGPLVEGEFEIFGQRLAGPTASPVGTNDFRISDAGLDGSVSYEANVPAVAWNSVANEYLVVWAAEENIGLLVPGEFEIYGQRLSAAGAELGVNDFRISVAGADGDATYDAYSPAVAYDRVDNQYLVVWEGEDLVGVLVSGENEIFGQRLNAGGSAIGLDDFLISDMGPDVDPLYDAQAPSVAYNQAANEYFVVWEGDDTTSPLVDGESEIFGQRINAANGLPVGDNDFRLSDMGVDGDPLHDATDPAVAYGSVGDRLLVLWRGDDDNGLLGPDEFEIFGQLYSDAAPVSVDGGHASGLRALSVAPNPIVTEARVSLEVDGAGPVAITLLDVSGRVRWSHIVNASAHGSLDVSIDLRGVANGTYFVRAGRSGNVATRKVTVTH